MPLTEIETEICEVVVRRLLDKYDATPRADLLRKFKRPLYVPLQKLTSRFVLSASTYTAGSETFLPKAIAFHYSKDAAALSLARRSTEIVLRAIRNLFDHQLDTGDEEPFTPEDVLEEAQKTDPAVSPDMVWLGLYLAEEFSVFRMIQKGANQVGIAFFQPTEHVYDVVTTDNFWDQRIQEGIKSVEHNWNQDGILDEFEAQRELSRSNLPQKEQLLKDSETLLRQHPTWALLVIDLDNFKSVNDMKGHPEGDACLDRIIRTIGKAIGRKGRIYRWGSGDEFAVLLPDFSSDEALATAERLRKAVEESKPGGEIAVTASIGVCGTDRTESRSTEEILSFADKAMYESKNSGKNRVTAWLQERTP